MENRARLYACAWRATVPPTLSLLIRKLIDDIWRCYHLDFQCRASDACPCMGC
ncbi:hypothetical protein BDA96_06G061000 [Sorghum bicolor]|uniref:Uncharacterized protein n=2 Tax=Sorghum bicolor TaxID=4558 RepID=A0A921UCG9_SORBI|nr:hypothetical protein BDA96_06G061000 [Sorghum bicolor]OQU81415.1 hypothetical protein SORBI_3006G054233 [Sorghum bicolor]